MEENSRRRDATRILHEIWVNVDDKYDLSKIKYFKKIEDLGDFKIEKIDDLSLSNFCVQQLVIPVTIDSKRILIMESPFKRIPKNIYDDFKDGVYIISRANCLSIIDKFFISTIGSLQFQESTKSIEAIKKILIKMKKLQSSDLTISWRQHDVSINYAVGGQNLHDSEDIISQTFAEKIRTSLINMSYENQSEKLIDGKFSIRLEDETHEYRLSVITTVAGYAISIRSYQKFDKDLTLSDLGYLEKPRKIIENILEHPYGVFLVTGPTGSGKTTTIYTIINQAFEEKNYRIKTAEDPVEIELHGIDQCQINTKGDLKHQITYPKLLSSFMRQRPDLIVIGEIRDSEVALATVEAALTGHKVISTLHTNKVESTFTRLTSNLSISEDRIEDSFSGVLSQRLVPKLCSCKIPDEQGVFKANEEGCEKCNKNHKIGFDGEIPAVEIANLEKGFQNFKPENFIEFYSYKDSARDLYEEGLIDLNTRKYIDSL